MKIYSIVSRVGGNNNWLIIRLLPCGWAGWLAPPAASCLLCAVVVPPCPPVLCRAVPALALEQVATNDWRDLLSPTLLKI